MKTPARFASWRTACAAIGIGIFALCPARAAAAPRVDALHVAKLATEYLATQGRNAPHIVSIALEKDGLLSGTTSWIVRWSDPVVVNGNYEVGMRVKLDGSVSYFVDEKRAGKKQPAR